MAARRKKKTKRPSKKRKVHRTKRTSKKPRKLSRAEARRAYYKLAASSTTPENFLAQRSRQGMTHRMYARARKLARLATRPVKKRKGAA